MRSRSELACKPMPAHDPYRVAVNAPTNATLASLSVNALSANRLLSWQTNAAFVFSLNCQNIQFPVGVTSCNTNFLGCFLDASKNSLRSSRSSAKSNNICERLAYFSSLSFLPPHLLPHSRSLRVSCSINLCAFCFLKCRSGVQALSIDLSEAMASLRTL